MTAENPTNAERVQDFGLAIFGPEWGAGMGRLCGINPRTMTRIKTAAALGKDYAAAAGVLAALSEALDALALRVRPFGKPDDPPPVQAAVPADPEPVKPPAAKPVMKGDKAGPVTVDGRVLQREGKPVVAADIKAGDSFSVPLAGTFDRRPMQKGSTKPKR